jgi:small-conductance mechanosensitive channel
VAREPGDVVRHEPAEAPLSVAVAIVLLTIVELAFVGLFSAGVVLGWNSPNAQQILTFWLASAFLVLGVILALYRRFYLDDIIVVKQRKEKWEDLL